MVVGTTSTFEIGNSVKELINQFHEAKVIKIFHHGQASGFNPKSILFFYSAITSTKFIYFG